MLNNGKPPVNKLLKKTDWIVVLLAIAGLLSLPACQAAGPTAPGPNAGNSFDIQYQTIAGVDPSLLKLDVYTSPELVNAPVVIFIHGGSWSSGDKSNVQKAGQFVDFFRRNHAVLVSANLRLMYSDLSPNTTYRDQAADVAAVVRWVYDHITEHGGDPGTIALFGYSSGAHLVALVGTDEQYLQAQGLGLSVVDSILCFDVDAYDIPRAIAEGKDYHYPAAAVNLPKYFTSDLQTQQAASPMSYISTAKKHPAFLVVYAGKQSGPAPQELSKRQSELFVDALKSANIPAILYGDLTLTHGQLGAQFGDTGFGPTNAAQEFLDEYFWKP